MKWLAIVVAALALAPAADAANRARPDAAAAAAEQIAPNAIQVFNDYVTPARAYTSQRAVVHYVALGVSAPPLNDDDADGVPDYVERVGDAADTAIAYFERRGFAPILADAGGPDARPDLYVSRFAAGYFGVAFPAADADGGAFLAVSNALDPSPAQSLGSLYGTVAHELFHLVQFSYFRPTVDPPLDAWVLEGTAAAMETRVYPDLEDIVSSLQLRHWFAAPEQSVTAQSYGAQLLWRYLDERHPQLLPAYLDEAGAARRGGCGGAGGDVPAGRAPPVRARVRRVRRQRGRRVRRPARASAGAGAGRRAHRLGGAARDPLREAAPLGPVGDGALHPRPRRGHAHLRGG